MVLVLALVLVMVPVLVVYADVIGVAGGAIIAHAYFDITPHSYLTTVTDVLSFREVFEGLVKAYSFGLIVAVVSCHQGLATKGGAEGVGRAITHAVVISFISIFIANYFITRLLA